ncbi:MAG: N-6 DNA methylase [Acidobacteriota bacterium]|nr:N-6 DNA methylase [Acidobacteriota bacterium]
MKLLTLEAVTSEGGLLPVDLLARVQAGDESLPALSPADYYLQRHERINEAAERAWSRATVLWRGLREDLDALPPGNHATDATLNRWLLPLFEELGYGRLDKAPAVFVQDRALKVTHLRKASPVHLVGWNVDLDRKSPAPGAQTAPPHGLLQELLNHRDDYLWGFVSNGRTLRVLRDHHSLTRQAYVEFDLLKIMDDELFSEFYLMWLVCHQSRVDAPKPEACHLETWLKTAREQGISALGKLREGVKDAIEILGAGFLAHAPNRQLRDDLSSGKLDKQDYYRALLRLVYRLIFMFTAEERGLLLDPRAPLEARDRYHQHYALRRLRLQARMRKGSAHIDLWRGLRLVMSCMAEGQPALALPALGSRLWQSDFVHPLNDYDCPNDHLLRAVRALAFTTEGKQTYPVNWRNVGADELGGVYEALLELHPVIDKNAALFHLRSAAGNDRKTSGSYYTPPELVDQLLSTALDPVLDEAVTQADPEAAVLALTICDPSCGSGHFLVAAAHRAAKRLAAVRTGDAEPAPKDTREALRDVIGHCIYGVDLNPMTVELCKLSLWLEALVPGKPLSFLDHHIMVGNSLLGATPALMGRGVPDDAFKPITGDHKKTAAAFAKRHRQERSGQSSLFAHFGGATAVELPRIVEKARRIEAIGDDDLAGVRQKEREYRALVETRAYRDDLFKADLWCAAMVWPKPADPDEDFVYAVPTQDTWQRVNDNPADAPPLTRRLTGEIAGQYRFFHWFLAFPQIFGREKRDIEAEDTTGWTGGFDVIVGNPPWERIKLQEKEWFAERNPAIAEAKNAAARKKAIAALPETEDGAELFKQWLEALRQSEGQSFILRTSGRYPFCARGDINTYTIFTELDRTCLAPRGRMGVVVPGGIAMDATTQFFFQDLVEKGSLHSLFHFENEEFIFPGVHHAVRFCLLTLSGLEINHLESQFVSYARQVGQIKDKQRTYSLSKDDFMRMNPNTRTLPAFRYSRDAEINRRIYARVPVLMNESPGEESNPWGVSFMRMLDMANDSDLFYDEESLVKEGWASKGNRFIRGDEVMLPLYEAKMIHHFNHRFGTYEGQTEAQARQGKLPECTPEMLDDPDFEVKPRYWVAKTEVDGRLQDRWEKRWLLGWRDICRSSDFRTVIASILPLGATGNTMPMAFFPESNINYVCLFAANLVSMILDYSARQKIGGTHLTYNYMKQLPTIDPERYKKTCSWDKNQTLHGWLAPRSLEMTYTSFGLEGFGRDSGYDCLPFRFDESRRHLLRAELDAAYFHLYGISRDDVDYIMESFWVVRQRDERQFGDYRTKLLILRCYDRMQGAMDTGKPYQTLLDPPPGDPSQTHPAKER